MSSKQQQFRAMLRQKAGQQGGVISGTSPIDRAASSQPETFEEVVAFHEQKKALQDLGLDSPYFRSHEGTSAATTVIGGKEYLNFSGYNYLGLSGDARVSKAAQLAVERYGTSVGASRIGGGEIPLHVELERQLADLIGVDDALVFVSGHATNVSVIGHLCGTRDLVLFDALAHNSILQGAVLSGARYMPFAHNDMASLEAILKDHASHFERILIAAEGVYSMDGDVADLPGLIALKKRYGAMLFLDEAHSLGILGATGRGVAEHFGIPATEVDLWMGTMSKSLASCGGFIAGSSMLIEYLKYTVPGFVFSVGMTPANAAAALTACRILISEPERVTRLRRNSKLFLDRLREQELNTAECAGYAVVPLVVGESAATLMLADSLFNQGIYAQPILHPAVAKGAERLRFFVTSEHKEEQLRQAADCVAASFRELKIRPDLAFPDSLGRP